MANMRCRHKCVCSFGVITMLLGITMLICGILLIVWGRHSSSFGAGIWGGVWVSLTGMCGVLSGAYSIVRMEITFMLMSIFAAIVIAASTALTTVAAQFYEANFIPTNLNAIDPSNITDNAYLVRVILVGVAIALFLFGIMSAISACCAVCECCGAKDETAVVPITCEDRNVLVATPNGHPIPFNNSYNNTQFKPIYPLPPTYQQHPYQNQFVHVGYVQTPMGYGQFQAPPGYFVQQPMAYGGSPYGQQPIPTGPSPLGFPIQSIPDQRPISQSPTGYPTPSPSISNQSPMGFDPIPTPNPPAVHPPNYNSLDQSIDNHTHHSINMNDLPPVIIH